MHKKIVFFGSDNNSAHLLQTLINNKFDILLCITKSDKKSGRNNSELIPTPVKTIAIQSNIEVLERDSLNKDDLELIKKLNPDVGILLAYGAMIPQNIINVFPLGILNIHPSLLPKYRGSSPIQYTLLKQEKFAGVSIMQLVKKMDAGPIIAQEKINIEEDDNYETLSKKLFELGEKILLESFDSYINKKIILITQVDDDATFSKIIEKEDGKINWNLDSDEINAKIKAYYLWPSTYTKFKNLILKIKSAKTQNIKLDKKIGEVFLYDKKIAIQCGNGILYPQTLQLEGKKVADINSFVNGYKDFIGSILN